LNHQYGFAGFPHWFGRFRHLRICVPGLNKWKVEDDLRTEEDIAEYWAACLIEGGDDPAFLTKALGEIARIHGMSQLARDTGISREGLYNALSGQGNPEFAT
jgi:probable addiction module antidote protein